jgi:mono/diheme cytochrome c family protein
LGILVVTAVCPLPARAQQANARKTVLEGVYTQAQATRGRAEFEMSCAACHEGAAFDGPVLEGGGFINGWREDTLESLFSYIKTGMPEDAPGSLSDAVYRDILAYLLQLNRYPAGRAELTGDAIANTLLVGEDGPKPLPPNTLVQVAGCFTAGPNATWILAKSSDPGRTRESDKLSPEELKRAAAKPLGTGTFRLQNLDVLAPAFNPEAHKGHKVLVKGVLIQQTNNDRINVTALDVRDASPNYGSGA